MPLGTAMSNRNSSVSSSFRRGRWRRPPSRTFALSPHTHTTRLWGGGGGGGGLDAAPVTHQTFPGLPRFSLALSAAENTTPRPTNPTHRLEIHILRLDGGLYSGANGFGVMRSVLQPDWHGFTFEHILIIDISRERSI